jgi:YD repeat-containing protein
MRRSTGARMAGEAWLRALAVALMGATALPAAAQSSELPWPIIQEVTYCSDPSVWLEDSVAACAVAAKTCKLPYDNWTAQVIVPPSTPAGGCIVQWNGPDGPAGTFLWTAARRFACGHGATLRAGLNRNEPIFPSDCEMELPVPLAMDPPPPECEVCKGNPIHPLRGVKREVVDTGLGIGNTTLQFTFDSSRKVPKVWTPPSLAVSDTGPRYGPLGSLLWSANLRRTVTSPRPTDTGTAPSLPQPTVMDRGNGVMRTFTSVGGGLPSAEPGNADRFVPSADGGVAYTDSAANAQERYTSQGALQTMAWHDGTRIEFSYSDATTPVSVAPGPGLLIQAIDNRGRSLNFAYTTGPDGIARMSTITDANGQVTTLGFDSLNNLSSITWHNGAAKTLLYERTDLPWALTGVSDERGLRYSTFGYDAEGRAISTEHAGGVDRYAVSYTTPPSIRVTEQRDGLYVARTSDWIAPQGMVMTEPSGQVTNWSTLSLNGKNYFSSQTRPAGAGSLQSSRSQAYDANGNIASRDDFNGTRSCYLNDLARNLKLAEVTGASAGQACAAVTTANAALPAGALKTSTQWHPDWSLPIKVAEPKQITINVYNGQPDPLNGNAIASCAPTAATLLDGKPIATLCKQVRRATTDADGHLGFGAALQPGTIDIVRTWTYGADGRLLAATDPDTGTTTFGYHTETDADHQRGDLKSITTSLGKVTTFDRYNRYGQVLQSTDVRGIVTVNTYDLRQRLLTNTVGGETTTYTYDAAGQLTLVTEYDGTWIGFEYDDAHRQTAVKDDEGNRIDYVLDNAGNQTDQRVKDPAGALKRNAARVMDALGRAQQSTGRE